MRKRDFLKKKAKQTGYPLIGQQYKHSRNGTNNEIKSAKRQYFKVNLEANKKNPKPTCNVISLSIMLQKQPLYT
jgi:TPR repeat protein